MLKNEGPFFFSGSNIQHVVSTKNAGAYSSGSASTIHVSTDRNPCDVPLY